MIGEATAGGAHVSIDALGSSAVAANSVRCLRRRGRHVQVGLLPEGSVPLPMDLVIARELEIYGSHGMAARDYPAMMRLVADGTLRPGLLVGDVIALEDTGRALAAMSGVTDAAGMTVVRLAVGPAAPRVWTSASRTGIGRPWPGRGRAASGRGSAH